MPDDRSKWQIIAERGDEVFLVETRPNLGRMLVAHAFGREMLVDDILKYGYWEDYSGGDHLGLALAAGDLTITETSPEERRALDFYAGGLADAAPQAHNRA